MRLHMLLIKLSQMFIEIFDVKVLNAIYPMKNVAILTDFCIQHLIFF